MSFRSSHASGSSRSVPAALDAALLVGVPAVLIGVYLLPMPVRRSLLLSTVDPRPAALVASHLVHLRPVHLLGNVAGYLLVAPTAYLLAASASRRRAFRVVAVAVLIAVPLALSGLDVVLPEGGVSYGFSGVVMGFLGLVPVATFWYLESRTGAVASRGAPGHFLLGLAVAAAAVPVGPAGDALAVVTLVGALAYLGTAGLTPGALRSLPPGGLELVAVAAVVVVGYPVVAFPADPSVRGGVLDLTAHLLGYVLAFLAAHLTAGAGILPRDPDEGGPPSRF